MGAKYSYGVWEQFADQASTILGNKKFELVSECLNSFRICVCVYLSLSLSLYIYISDLSLRPDDGRVHFRVFLEKTNVVT